jgi:hypothetical protein
MKELGSHAGSYKWNTTSPYRYAKMAEDGVTCDIENALNKIVNTTDQSGKLRKELKKTIFETVSTPRNLFMTLKVQIGGKSKKVRLERELQATKTTVNE